MVVGSGKISGGGVGTPSLPPLVAPSTAGVDEDVVAPGSVVVDVTTDVDVVWPESKTVDDGTSAVDVATPEKSGVELGDVDDIAGSGGGTEGSVEVTGLEVTISYDTELEEVVVDVDIPLSVDDTVVLGVAVGVSPPVLGVEVETGFSMPPTAPPVEPSIEPVPGSVVVDDVVETVSGGVGKVEVGSWVG